MSTTQLDIRTEEFIDWYFGNERSTQDEVRARKMRTELRALLGLVFNSGIRSAMEALPEEQHTEPVLDATAPCEVCAKLEYRDTALARMNQLLTDKDA